MMRGFCLSGLSTHMAKVVKTEVLSKVVQCFIHVELDWEPLTSHLRAKAFHQCDIDVFSSTVDPHIMDLQVRPPYLKFKLLV